MAASKFPTEWPALAIREFNTVERSWQRLRDLVRSLNDMRTRIVLVGNDHADRLTATTSAGIPATTPTDTLLFHLDTTNKDMYVSVGTASSADWKKITP